MALPLHEPVVRLPLAVVEGQGQECTMELVGSPKRPERGWRFEALVRPLSWKALHLSRLPKTDSGLSRLRAERRVFASQRRGNEVAPGAGFVADVLSDVLSEALATLADWLRFC